MSHALDKTTVKRILQLHQLQGLSPQIIGQRFGFTTARIYNIIRRKAPGPKLQAPSLKKDIIERYNKRMKDKTTVKKEYQADGTKRQYVLDKAVKFITDKNPAYGTQGDRHHFLLDKVGLSETEYLDCLNKAVQ